MTREKEELLDACHTDFLEICFGDFPMERIHSKVSNKITGYGTNINEKIQSFNDFINLLKMQREEAKGIDMKFQFNMDSKTMIAQNDAAIFVDEIKLTMVIEGSNFELNVRVTSIFEYTQSQWWAVNFHGSLAQGVEGDQDIWAVNEWKEKNAELEKIIAERTEELRQSLEHLEATQEQLILQEKLASLGQLAAGIAHEIKNPMNFVNNFSELSLEYTDEMRTALNRLEKNETTTEITDLLGDIEENLKKIHQHGTRADGIVKSMLMHSRGGNGVSEPTDLNELIREYVNLAFHGMRAGKTAINVKIELDLDENLPPVSLNTEDFSRVILNLCKNAFDAMREKELKQTANSFKAVLRVQTKTKGNQAITVIEDNGPGVPDAVRKKLFEPFFTTKKGTEGTGLGLSITRDIIKNHRGEIHLESGENQFTRFTIELPIH